MINKNALVAGFIVSVGMGSHVLGQSYVEGVNDQLAVDDVWTATKDHEQAFRWSPSSSFDLSQILWHSSPIQSGVIRIRNDTGGQPGAILREVSFSAARDGWNGAPFAQPLAIFAGRSYFVSFQCLGHDYSKFICVDDPTAIALTYYWTPDGNAWNGPYTWGGRRMIKFFEAGPCYADCDTSTGVGVLDIFDFLCFQNSFVNADPYACDCDTSTGPGVCDIFDFLCFQGAFVGGCP